jgi:hypothetical protein
MAAKTVKTGMPPSAPEDLLATALRDALAANAKQVATADDTKPEPAPKPDVNPEPKVSLWQHHGVGRILQPLAWTATADGAASCWHCAVHCAGAGSVAAMVGGGILTLAAAGRTLWVLHGKTGGRRRAKRALASWLAAAAWAQPAIWATMSGPYGTVQELALAGGIALGAGHLHAGRRQELAWQPVAALPAAEPEPGADEAPEDGRLAKFRKRFVDGSGTGSKAHPPLHHAVLEDLSEVDGGFAFTVVANPGTNVSKDTVIALRGQIAALYDVPVEQVMVDDAPRRSARRCRVTVLTMQDAFAEPRRWDGVSSYDPKTGTYRHGRFGDGTPGRWQIHVPSSGMWGGAVYGAMGTGKSFDLHLLAAHAGIVVQCPDCGAHHGDHGTCAECDSSRLFLLFMGDPQMRAFSPWKGRADLTFWGVLGCVFQMRFLREVMIERDKDASTMTRTDKKGRVREGMGWFDPSPVRPGILGVTDEWTKVVESPYSQQAVGDMETVLQEARKSGLSVNFAAQMPDAGKTGGTRAVQTLTRHMNIVAHRLDAIGKAMTPVQGSAVDLPSGDGMAGIGYIAGIDDRSAAPFRTDYLPEDAAEGIDVLDMALAIKSLPVRIDPAVQRVMNRYGLNHRDVVTDEWVADLWQREAAEAAEAAAAARAPGNGAPAATVPAQTASAASGPVTLGAMRSAADAVTACLDEEGRPADLYDVMQRTGLAAGPASRALTALKTNGEVTEDAGTWRPAGGTAEQQAVSGA